MTNKKHNYDWDAMNFDPDKDRIIGAFLWHHTPQGNYWWGINADNPVGKAEFACMKRLYAEDMAEKKGPVTCSGCDGEGYTDARALLLAEPVAYRYYHNAPKGFENQSCWRFITPQDQAVMELDKAEALYTHPAPVTVEAAAKDRELLQRAVDLIQGELVGGEWKKACNEFVKDARRALSMEKS